METENVKTIDEMFERYFELQNKNYLDLTNDEKKELDLLIEKLSENDLI